MNLWGIFFLMVFCPGIPLLLGISIEISKNKYKRRNSMLIAEGTTYKEKTIQTMVATSI